MYVSFSTSMPLFLFFFASSLSLYVFPLFLLFSVSKGKPAMKKAVRKAAPGTSHPFPPYFFHASLILPPSAETEDQRLARLEIEQLRAENERIKREMADAQCVGVRLLFLTFVCLFFEAACFGTHVVSPSLSLSIYREPVSPRSPRAMSVPATVDGSALRAEKEHKNSYSLWHTH